MILKKIPNIFLASYILIAYIFSELVLVLSITFCEEQGRIDESFRLKDLLGESILKSQLVPLR